MHCRPVDLAVNQHNPFRHDSSNIGSVFAVRNLVVSRVIYRVNWASVFVLFTACIHMYPTNHVSDQPILFSLDIRIIFQGVFMN